MTRVEGTVRDYAKLGDAVVNFVVSAALTLAEGRPCGVKVPDKLLRAVAVKGGLSRRGSATPEDLFEALAAHAWLRGLSIDEMIRAVAKGLGSGDMANGLEALLSLLVSRVDSSGLRA